MNRHDIDELADDAGITTLLMDGFDEAFLGFSQRCGQETLAVYSLKKMIDVLVFRDGMTFDEAHEYIEFNCIGAWVGEQTPVIVNDTFIK